MYQRILITIWALGGLATSLSAAAAVEVCSATLTFHPFTTATVLTTYEGLRDLYRHDWIIALNLMGHFEGASSLRHTALENLERRMGKAPDEKLARLREALVKDNKFQKAADSLRAGDEIKVPAALPDALVRFVAVEEWLTFQNRYPERDAVGYSRETLKILTEIIYFQYVTMEMAVDVLSPWRDRPLETLSPTNLRAGIPHVGPNATEAPFRPLFKTDRNPNYPPIDLRDLSLLRDLLNVEASAGGEYQIFLRAYVKFLNAFGLLSNGGLKQYSELLRRLP